MDFPCNASDSFFHNETPPSSGWHQLRAVRRREHVTVRTMAKRLGVTVPKVKEQEQESNDIMVSTLLAWASALEVPPAELLGEINPGLAPELALRARLIRVVKTIRALQEKAKTQGVKHLADNLMRDVLEMCPELEDVKAWPQFGTRTMRCGRALLNPVNTHSLPPGESEG